jgi:cytochrome b subunit of formate dehydrogenase
MKTLVARTVWTVAVTAILLPVEGLQIVAGYSRSLVIHIPLGTTVVATAVFLAAWSWTSRIRIGRQL